MFASRVSRSGRAAAKNTTLGGDWGPHSRGHAVRNRVTYDARLQPLHEIRVLVGVETLPQLGEHGRDVTRQQRLDGEPQAGKDGAVEKPRPRRAPAAGTRRLSSTNQSICRSWIRQTTYFANPVATVDAQLVVQVVADAAGSYLDDQLRPPPPDSRRR